MVVFFIDSTHPDVQDAGVSENGVNHLIGGWVMVVTRRLETCRVLLAWPALAVLLLSSAVSANTVTLSYPSPQFVTAGTYFISFRGSPPQLFPGLSTVVFAPDAGQDFGAMVFDLSFIPKGTPITSASFTMSVGGSNFIKSQGLDVEDYVGTGHNVSLDDLRLPTNILGVISVPGNAPPGSIDVVQTFDVSGFIQSLVNNGTPYAGFQFGHYFMTPGGTLYIPGSTAPSLTITSPAFLTVPEPRSALMLAMGIGGVLLVSLTARSLRS